MYKARELTADQKRVNRLIKRAVEDYIYDGVMSKSKALAKNGLKYHDGNREKFERELEIQLRPIFGEDLRKGAMR